MKIRTIKKKGRKGGKREKKMENERK